jgi:hypothetical protein
MKILSKRKHSLVYNRISNVNYLMTSAIKLAKIEDRRFPQFALSSSLLAIGDGTELGRVPGTIFGTEPKRM